MGKISSFVFLVLVVFSCSQKAEIKGKTDYKGPMLVAHDLDVIYTDSARIKFTMKTPEQIKHQDQNETFPKGIHIEFYNNKEEKETSLSSKYAEFKKDKDEWFVKDSVVLNNFNRKRILKSEELYWNPKTQEVWCDTNVRVIIETEDQTLWGKGLKAKDDFSDYEIYTPTGSFDL